MEGRHYLIRDGEVTNVFSQKKHITDAIHLRGAQLDVSTVVQTVSSIYEEGDKGKCHFPPTYSGAWEWKPAKSLIRQKKSEEAFERGKRILVPNVSGHQVPGHVKLFPEELIRRSETNNKMFEVKRVVMMEGQKGTEYEGQIVPRKFRRGDDWPMEQYMNRKQRSVTLEVQRNGIPAATPGDHAFKIVEHSDKYYAQGGLIAGSTIQLRQKSSVVMKKGNDSQPRMTTTKKLISYADKFSIAKKEEELEDVRVLTNPYIKLNQEIPSWESRTGFYIIKPEDEAD